MQAKKYPSLPKGGAKGGVSAAAEAEDGDESDTSEDREGGGASTSSGGYEYLLGMPLWSLTMERVQQLLKEQQEKKDEFARLSATSPEQLWETDLDLFLERLQVWPVPQIDGTWHALEASLPQSCSACHPATLWLSWDTIGSAVCCIVCVFMAPASSPA